MKIPLSEMPLSSDGRIYHLNLFPEEIANKIILVGDPGRVPNVSQYFDKIEYKRANREIVTHTGYLNGQSLSVISTGMGTDNIDIVLNELDALANIDLKTGLLKSEPKSLQIVRIGTCGAIHADIPINEPVASAYAFGMDGLLHFYKHQHISEQTVIDDFVKHQHWNPNLAKPYLVGGSEKLINQIAFDIQQGITVTAPGFYGPQGRVLRLPIADEKWMEKLQHFEYKTYQVLNLEMETSGLYAMGRLLGHEVLTVCLAIANRVTKKFATDYHESMNHLIQKILERITLE